MSDAVITVPSWWNWFTHKTKNLTFTGSNPVESPLEIMDSL